ncbi:uncharacterized protein LOC132066629 [Lycium ferocissimum]|uniref:uncharacterized protein LOC132066629 n=1 Tax=Lycium ferocissimum TaxID=112874 RepID=UPI0028167D95|nr:uncharacterized protein LOC132066629 [Lycium ferocissimum]
MLTWQDLCTGKVRGIGKEKESLYILDPATSSSYTSAYHQALVSSVAAPISQPHHPSSSSPSTTTWHQRLGHAPFTVLQHIPSIKNHFLHKDAPICSVCPLSRQTRSPFPIKLKKSDPF